jgi:LysM repeat protein
LFAFSGGEPGRLDTVPERVSCGSMTDSVLARPVTTPVTPATAAVCPYLLASDGRWRASTVAREHRCTVVSPPAILAAEKQRRLCLTAEHVGCSTYLAAIDATDPGEEGPARADHRRTREVTRTAPLVLDHGRLAIGVPALRVERGAGQQSGLVALMAVAFAAIVVARLSAGGPDLTPVQAVGGAAASPTGAISPAPTTQPIATDDATRTLVPTEVEPTPAPPAATGTPAAAPRTYKVRSGDTLGAIAREFDTTVAALQELNDIDDPRLLRVGQVLELP